MSSSKTDVPDAIFFELSPKIVCGVRLMNVLTLLMIVITFILCLIRGGENSVYYLLACNTVISAFVGIVVVEQLRWQTVDVDPTNKKNWWYRGGDLGSEKFWYILVVAVVLIFQCITTDIFIFQVEEASTVAPTSGNVTKIYTWATFRTTNNSLLHILPTTTHVPFY